MKQTLIGHDIASKTVIPHQGAIELVERGVRFSEGDDENWHIMQIGLAAAEASRIRLRVVLTPEPDDKSTFYIGRLGPDTILLLDLDTLTFASGANADIKVARRGADIEIIADYDLTAPILFMGTAAAGYPIHKGGKGTQFTVILIEVDMWPMPAENIKNGAVVISSDFRAQRPDPELSTIEVPVGTCSQDRILVVGRDGYMFVYEGSNNHPLQCCMPDEVSSPLIENWQHVIDRRRVMAREAGCQFVQIVIPEKATLLPELAPFDTYGGTPLLRALSQRYGAAEDYVDVVKLFKGDDRFIAYPKITAHMSPFGSFVMFDDVLRRLKLTAPRVDFGAPAPVQSDLADQWNGMQLYDRVSPVISDDLATAEKGLVETDRVLAERYVGTGRTWENASAPVRKRVLVFGNSFFGAGDYPPQLSWWFARWFSAFRIVWQPAYDPEIVAAYRPDIVICQTVERFMGRVPAM